MAVDERVSEKPCYNSGDGHLFCHSINGAYSGTLVDDNDLPMADRTLRLSVANSPFEAVASQQTDNAGRFRFNG